MFYLITPQEIHHAICALDGSKRSSAEIPLKSLKDNETLNYAFAHGLTLKMLEVNLTPPVVFEKCVFQTKGEALSFVIFKIIICHIIPENFIEIPHVLQKILRFSCLTLTIFINLSDFLTFPCYKETNDISKFISPILDFIKSRPL